MSPPPTRASTRAPSGRLTPDRPPASPRSPARPPASVTGRSRQRAASDLRQKPLAGGLHDVEDLLEAPGGAVVGIGHLEIPARGALWIELAQQPDLRTLALIARERSQLARVFAVHR